MTKCFLTVSLLITASSHSAKDRPNQSQWGVLQYSQPQSASFSVCLSYYLHFLSVSILIFSFCLSPSLSLFFVCLHLYPHFLSVSVQRKRQKEKKRRDGDRQIMRIEMETNKNEDKVGDRQKIRKTWRQTNNGDK